MKTRDVCVVGGCGHVGLPLSISFAAAGRKVAVYDINRKAVEAVRRGRMPFMEDGAEPLLRQVLKSGRLQVSGDRSVIRSCEAVIVVIGTPVDEHLNPNLLMIRRAVDDVLPHLRDGQLLVLRSTVYPGTTKMIERHLRRKGRRLDVAFCPERIAQGQALKEYKELPQIVSGVTPAALARARELFSPVSPRLVEAPVLQAELAKLFNNSWRYLKFAVANQFFMIANDCGVDFYEVYKVMTHQYPRAADFPLPGFAAGPCLLKDTMQLAAFNRHQFFMGHAAMLINEGLPDYIVRELKNGTDLSGKTVGILGMAFKAENDDVRDSLSFKLRKLLEFECREVLCSDEYVKDPSFIPAEKLVRKSDIVVIGAPHKRYKSLDYRGARVVDIWNVTGKFEVVA